MEKWQERVIAQEELRWGVRYGDTHEFLYAYQGMWQVLSEQGHDEQQIKSVLDELIRTERIPEEMVECRAHAAEAGHNG